MQQPISLVGKNHIEQQTRHILIIDDNVTIRSLLARHIMLSCNNRERSCAIYRLGERAMPSLTYNSDPNYYADSEEEIFSDFTIYEAGSPRHALAWLQQSNVKQLTIISDVMMPVDTEVGLPGLLNGLHELQVGVNLVFMSSEPQNLSEVQYLLNDQRAFFLIKGSDSWSRLPEALIAGAERFSYRVLPRRDYTNPALFQKTDVGLNTPVKATDRRLSATPALAHSAPADGGDYRARREVAASNEKSPGFWARLFGRIRH